MVGNRLAPAVPHWITMEREAEMQIDEGILKCSVFLGAPNERGFGAEGSGFFVYLTEEELDFTYVVTCRHVIHPFAAGQHYLIGKMIPKFVLMGRGQIPDDTGYRIVVRAL